MEERERVAHRIAESASEDERRRHETVERGDAVRDADAAEARRTRVARSAERVMSKHRPTFAALAK